MKQRDKLLLELCKAFFDNAKPVMENEINIEDRQFFKFCEEHNLVGVCHCAIHSTNGDNPLSAELQKAMQKCFVDYIFRYECQNVALEEIKEIFQKEQIKYVLFKGAVLRQLYPVPEARAMGDIDLLIDINDRSKVKSLMEKNGYLCTSKGDNVYTFEKANAEIEVHTEIITEFGKDSFSDAFENSVFDGVQGQLEDNYHFAYLIAHTANHLKYTGAGVRFVLDLAIMQREKNIDMDKVFSILEKVNLVTFAKVILSICYDWFGVGQAYTENTDKVKEYLLEDGVFGSLKDDIRATLSRLAQLKTLDEKNNSSLKLKLKLAFPSYETIRKASYINFIDGRPYLLPIAWIYRLGYNLKNTPEHMKRTIKNVDDEKTLALVKEEQEFFEEIGLL